MAQGFGCRLRQSNREAWNRFCAAIWLTVTLSAISTSAASAGPTRQAEAPVDPASIHVLAIGSCPPWRPKIRVCKHDVQQFAEAARDLIGVPPEQITTLANEEATASDVRAAFAKLKELTPQGSTLIVYYVGHGMILPNWGQADGSTQETFLLWSRSFPFAALYAVQAGIWMTDAELGGLIGTLPAESALVILDTCEASGADNAIVSSSSLPKLEEVAVMASSRAHQIAFADLTSAVFTRNLVEAMHTQSPTLHEAFLLAQRDTVTEAALRCEGAVASGSVGEDCTPQEPELVDPSGLAKRIRLNSN
jgi:hypothetical protein